MSETPLHGGGGPAPRHLMGFSEVLKQEPHGALLWKESNSILACLGVSRCPASCPLSRGFVCSACPASVPSFQQYHVPGQGPVPCVTLAEQGRPCPHPGSRAAQRPCVTGEAAGGAWRLGAHLLSALMLLRRTCMRAQGLGEATRAHVGHIERKGLLGRQSQALGRPGRGTQCWSRQMSSSERGCPGRAGQPAAGGAEHTSCLEGWFS